MHITSNFKNASDLKNQKIKNATYFALIVSTVLCVLKYLNYYLTGSTAIHASALDSLMDITVSLANFAAIHFIQKDKNEKFANGFDKIASLVAFLQAILVAFLSVNILFECYEHFYHPHSVDSFGYGIIITIFSLFLNAILVYYQKKVVKETGSIVIKADMLHFQTDFLSNGSILLGFFFIWKFNIVWLDPILGLFISCYLIYSVYDLFIESAFSLLDINCLCEKNEILNLLNKNEFNIKSEQIIITFSGVQHLIKIKVENMDIKSMRKIKDLIQNNFRNYQVEFSINLDKINID